MNAHQVDQKLNQRYAEVLRRLRDKLGAMQAEFAALSPEQKAEVLAAQSERAAEADRVGEFFAGLKENPCPTCVDHCCKNYEAFGFHKGLDDTHPDVVADPEKLLQYLLPPRPSDFVPAAPGPAVLDPTLLVDYIDRCFFLSPTGCNLPMSYRSHTCLGYQCGKLKKVTGTEYSAIAYSSAPVATLYQIGKRIDDIVYPAGPGHYVHGNHFARQRPY